MFTHHTDGSTKGLGGKVGAELSLDDTVTTVGAGDTTPDNTDLAAVDLTLGAIDVSDALAQVELSILRSLNTLDLNERGVLVLVALGTLVAQNTALAVQAVLNSNMFRLVLRFFYSELCCLWCIFRSMLEFQHVKVDRSF